LNVTVDKTSVYSAIISWTIPVVPKPFHRTANITCSVETVSDKNVKQVRCTEAHSKTVYIYIYGIC